MTGPEEPDEPAQGRSGQVRTGFTQDSEIIVRTVTTMRQTSTTRTTVTLHELPAPTPAPARTLPERDQVVFVTNAVRRRGTLRTRGDQHRPVLAVVVR